MSPRSASWPNLALSEDNSAAGLDLATRLMEVQKQCKAEIESANQYQERYANKKRLQAPFKIGDKVLVANKNIKSSRPKKKLDWKYLGPGTVVAQYGHAAFKVDLPGFKSIHPVFHASLLEPYTKKGPIPQPQDQLVDTLRVQDEDVYEVEDIKEKRRRKDHVWEYLIKWKGYGPEHNSWEPGSNISAKALQVFWSRLKHRQEGNLPSKTRERRERGRGRPRKRGG